jgi:hypothetical protein
MCNSIWNTTYFASNNMERCASPWFWGVNPNKAAIGPAESAGAALASAGPGAAAIALVALLTAVAAAGDLRRGNQ